MDSMLDLADRLWRGETPIEHANPMSPRNELADVADGTVFINSFANVSALRTEAGLALIDSGSPMTGQTIHGLARGWNSQPLHTVIYTHGHIDHVFGVQVFEEEARAKGWPMPRVIGHEAVAARFDRYRLTAGYNAVINRRQFRIPDLAWPTEYRYPDETFREELALEIGGERLELHHARGETDDHTWVWIPGRKVLCCGDFFIWCVPNAGNPQKVQRYAREWALALRAMAAVGAEVLLPGHGYPIIGAARIRETLTDTADLLDALHDQTLALMNAGADLDEIIHSVRTPQHLLEKPYLRPIYDEPEFILRNIWRLYGGWYDGNPANLKPAPDAELAGELAALVGGAARLASRARELAEEGKLRLAGHLAEMAALAAADDPAIHAARADVFEQRASTESSLMAKGIFSAAARESRARAR
ncbi:MAG TPA: alkyl sulfatase dimerization domain-containing protein [Ktedonobacterales bacterium]